MSEIVPLDHNTIVPAQPHAVGTLESLATAEEMAILNDDVMIESPPVRASGTIRVRLVYAGRSTPIPSDEPWAD